MKSITLLFTLITLLAAYVGCAAEETDKSNHPLLPKSLTDMIVKSVDKCDKAKATMDAEINKQREQVMIFLKAEADKALTAGNLNKVNAIKKASTSIEGGDPSQWIAATNTDTSGGKDDSGAIKFAGIGYNPGLIARVWRNGSGGMIDVTKKSPYVFVLTNINDWDAIDKILLDKTRGKYADWDPRFNAYGNVILDNDATITVKSIGANIAIDGKVITEIGNWEGQQTFDLKLTKGVHVITASQMNWMSKRFVMEIIDKKSGKGVLYHVPQNLVSEMAFILKSPGTVTASELITIVAP